MAQVVHPLLFWKVNTKHIYFQVEYKKVHNAIEEPTEELSDVTLHSLHLGTGTVGWGRCTEKQLELRMAKDPNTDPVESSAVTKKSTTVL